MMPNSYVATSAKKFLDADGLTYFSRKLNNYPDNTVLEAVVEGIQDALDEKINIASIGVTDGVASLDENGKVPETQLPSSFNTTYTLTQNSSDGHILTFTPSEGNATIITIPDNDTTYDPVTTSANGLMLSTDKIKLNSISDGANASSVSYDTTNKKITKTIDNTTTDVVTVATLKTDMAFTKTDIGLDNVENKSSSTIRSEITSSNVTSALGYTPINLAIKGASNGLAELDEYGQVPSSQLPSYVDDVLEFANRDAFPATGSSGKIYINLADNKTYRWSGSTYVEISESLALGENSSTAYRGDRGKTAYDHAQAKGSAYASGLYKVTTNSEGHVTSASLVQKSDITGLGIPGQDTTYVFDGTYNASTNKAATEQTVNSAVDAIETELSGKVDGPSSSVANRIATFADTSGKKIKDSGYTIATSVPASALFTDASVTSASNHYTPTRDSSADKHAEAEGATAAWSIDVISGVTLETDGKGHVTGVSVTSGKIPANPNTDTLNTAGSTNKTSTKMYLVAAENQVSSSQTYSNSNCYIGTDNCLYSNGSKVITSITSIPNSEIDALFA